MQIKMLLKNDDILIGIIFANYLKMTKKNNTDKAAESSQEKIFNIKDQTKEGLHLDPKEIAMDVVGSLQKKVAELESALSNKQQELNASKDAMLHALADLENYRKRFIKERSEIRGNVVAEMIEVLLPVIDNFEFGLSSAEKHNDSSIATGFKMIFSQLKNILASYNVEEINPLHQMFDMRYHDCVRQVEDDSNAEGVVVAVDRKGYKINDKLLRPAIVAVACNKNEQLRTDAK